MFLGSLEDHEDPQDLQHLEDRMAQWGTAVGLHSGSRNLSKGTLKSKTLHEIRPKSVPGESLEALGVPWDLEATGGSFSPQRQRLPLGILCSYP